MIKLGVQSYVMVDHALMAQNNMEHLIEELVFSPPGQHELACPLNPVDPCIKSIRQIQFKGKSILAVAMRLGNSDNSYFLMYGTLNDTMRIAQELAVESYYGKSLLAYFVPNDNRTIHNLYFKDEYAFDF